MVKCNHQVQAGSNAYSTKKRTSFSTPLGLGRALKIAGTSNSFDRVSLKASNTRERSQSTMFCKKLSELWSFSLPCSMGDSKQRRVAWWFVVNEDACWAAVKIRNHIKRSEELISAVVTCRFNKDGVSVNHRGEGEGEAGD